MSGTERAPEAARAGAPRAADEGAEAKGPTLLGWRPVAGLQLVGLRLEPRKPHLHAIVRPFLTPPPMGILPAGAAGRIGKVICPRGCVEPAPAGDDPGATIPGPWVTSIKLDNYAHKISKYNEPLILSGKEYHELRVELLPPTRPVDHRDLPTLAIIALPRRITHRSTAEYCWKMRDKWLKISEPDTTITGDHKVVARGHKATGTKKNWTDFYVVLYYDKLIIRRKYDCSFEKKWWIETTTITLTPESINIETEEKCLRC